MNYINIGRIVNTHGIKGELRIISDFDRKDIIFKAGFTLYIGENYEPLKIVTYRKHKNFDMVLFEGYDNINQVLKYLKMKVYVKREDLELGKNEYILDDLRGLTIKENGEIFGKVLDIVYNGSSTLLYVQGERNFYIPVVERYIKKVDLDKQEIEVVDIKGLIL